MMDITKCYIGKYVFPIGKPIIFVTGTDDSQKYYCERVIFFEAQKGKVIRYAQGKNVLKAEYKYYKDFFSDSSEIPEEKLLELFMNEVGVEFAKSDIFNIMYELEPFNPNISFEIDLAENEVIHGIMYLKRKFPNELKWLGTATRSQFLKRLIGFADGISTFDTEM